MFTHHTHFLACISWRQSEISEAELRAEMQMLDRKKIFLFRYEDLCAIGFTVSSPHALHRNEEELIMFEHLVQSVFSREDCLPFQFGTMFQTEEEIILLLKTNYHEYSSNLVRVRGCAEIALSFQNNSLFDSLQAFDNQEFKLITENNSVAELDTSESPSPENLSSLQDDAPNKNTLIQEENIIQPELLQFASESNNIPENSQDQLHHSLSTTQAENNQNRNTYISPQIPLSGTKLHREAFIAHALNQQSLSSETKQYSLQGKPEFAPSLEKLELSEELESNFFERTTGNHDNNSIFFIQKLYRSIGDLFIDAKMSKEETEHNTLQIHFLVLKYDAERFTTRVQDFFRVQGKFCVIGQAGAPYNFVETHDEAIARKRTFSW